MRGVSIRNIRIREIGYARSTALGRVRHDIAPTLYAIDIPVAVRIRCRARINIRVVTRAKVVPDFVWKTVVAGRATSIGHGERTACTRPDPTDAARLPIFD